MKISSVLFVSGALVVALGGAVVARGLMTPPPKPVAPHPVVKVTPAPSYTPVLMASREIKPGEFITSSDIRWHQVKQDYPGELYLKKDAVDLAENYGATVRRVIKPGELLTYDAVVKPGQPGFISSVLSAGKRAVAIPTDAVSSSSGLVQAGDHVDVILGLKRAKHSTSSGSSSTVTPPQLASQTLVTNVRVLALNNQERSELRVREEKSKQKSKAVYPETVTLEVTPKQAEVLAVAKEVGTLQLVIRGVNDVAPQANPALVNSVSDNVTTVSQVTKIYQRLEDSVSQVALYKGDEQSQVQLTH